MKLIVATRLTHLKLKVQIVKATDQLCADSIDSASDLSLDRFGYVTLLRHNF